jgi:hypothetical protein
MYRRLGILMLLLAPIGCYTPITRRLDNANTQMSDVRGQLVQANVELAAMRTHVEKMGTQLELANKRLQPLERLMKPLLDAGPEPAVPISAEQCWEGKVKASNRPRAAD